MRPLSIFLCSWVVCNVGQTVNVLFTSKYDKIEHYRFENIFQVEMTKVTFWWEWEYIFEREKEKVKSENEPIQNIICIVVEGNAMKMMANITDLFFLFLLLSSP